VDVHCPGVPPDALKPLVEQLNKSVTQLIHEMKGAPDTEAIQSKADYWRTRYEQLQDQLAAIGLGTKLRDDADDALTHGDLDKAGEILDRLLTQQQKNFDESRQRMARTYLARAGVYELQFRYPEALDQYARARQADRENSELDIPYGILLTNTGHYQEAETVLREAAGFFRNSTSETDKLNLAGALIDLAYLLAKEGRLSEAEELLKPATIIFSENKKTSAGAALDYANLLRFLAETQQLQGKDKMAQQSLSEALEILNGIPNRQSEPKILSATAIILQVSATIDMDDKRSSEALNSMRESISLLEHLGQSDPSNPLFPALQGKTEIIECSWLRGLKQPDSAAEVCSEGVARIDRLKVAPVWARAMEAEGMEILGQIALGKGAYFGAMPAFKQGLAIYSELESQGFKDYDLERAELFCKVSITEAHIGLSGPALSDMKQSIQLVKGTPKESVAEACRHRVEEILGIGGPVQSKKSDQ
jgi:tetratricopeptide (TPR) repeat protein